MTFSSISIEVKGDIHIVEVLERRIFMKITDTFRDEVIKAIELGAEKLIIDLTHVNVMNSSGLGVLILARDRMLKKNGLLVLCGLQPVMAEIFARMHLDSFFNISLDLAQALEMIQTL